MLVALVDRILEHPRHGRPINHATLPAFSGQELLRARAVVLGRLPDGDRVQPPREFGFVRIPHRQLLGWNRFDAFDKGKRQE